MPSGLLWNHHLWHGLRRGAPRRKGLLSGEAQIFLGRFGAWSWVPQYLNRKVRGCGWKETSEVQRYRNHPSSCLPHLVVTCSFELNPITPQLPVLSN